MAKQPEVVEQERRTAPRRNPLGCLLSPILAPFNLIFKQIRFFLVVVVVVAVSCAACGIFAPLAFQSLINFVRNTGVSTYVFVMRITGSPALKLITYEADVTARASANRDMGVLGLAFGQGAEVMGTVRISLGGDIENKHFGILTCDIDTSSVRTTAGSAPLAGFAFDLEQIEQAAYEAFKEEAARQALEKYWPEARKRLRDQFVAWALGLSVPDEPDLKACPENMGASAVLTATPPPR